MSAGWLVRYLLRQQHWSAATFGLGRRTVGICRHIASELDEIRAEPTDLSEWIDVMILAMDGYWRAGGNPATLPAALLAKQRVNLARRWPAPQPEDEPTRHLSE